jgi:hypothetical protein
MIELKDLKVVWVRGVDKAFYVDRDSVEFCVCGFSDGDGERAELGKGLRFCDKGEAVEVLLEDIVAVRGKVVRQKKATPGLKNLAG